MELRKLVSGDAPAFQALRLRGLLECPEAFSSSHAEEVDTPLHVVAERLVPRTDSAVFGHFAGASLAGLIGVQREARRKLSHKAFIWGMYVAPEYRLKGSGRSLVERALQYASEELGVMTVNLGVNTRNTAAIALYEAAGFRTYGTERGFLMVEGVPRDEHLMSFDFSGHGAPVAKHPHAGG